MEYNEVYRKLKKRALDFHRVLTEHGIYTQPLSEPEFLRRIHSALEDTAKNLVNGFGDPGVMIVGFPQRLLFDIDDVIRTSTHDTEDSPEELFECLKETVEKAGFRFSWKLRPLLGRLVFKLNSTKWSVACTSLEQEDMWMDPINFCELEPRFFSYLEKHDWKLYSVATGDQVLRFVMMPVNAVDAVKDYLFASYYEAHPDHDPRSDWVDFGVPIEKLPPSIWEQ